MFILILARTHVTLIIGNFIVIEARSSLQALHSVQCTALLAVTYNQAANEQGRIYRVKGVTFTKCPWPPRRRIAGRGSGTLFLR